MMRLSVRSRYRLVLLILVAFLFRLSLRSSLFLAPGEPLGVWRGSAQAPHPDQVPPPISDWEVSGWEPAGAVYRKKVYKPELSGPPTPPVADPFPLLSRNPPPAPGSLRAPRVNRPPQKHSREQTPLFVGFTRNWPLLLQCVVSYIAAGWPAEDILVVENTGVMHANRDGKLTLQNPFYLNHTQLAMLGVSVITTPTLLTFSQLQNFYLWTALARNHPYFFWTHQDLLVFSFENKTASPTSSASLYANALATLRHLTTTTTTTTTNPADAPTEPKPKPKPWAHHFFAYDHLTLVHRDAVLDVLGGWDTQIPFYASDCDAYLRARWAGLAQTRSEIGLILDVGSAMADLGALLRLPGSVARLEGDEEDRGSGEGDNGGGYVESWERLVALGGRMQHDKYVNGNGLRNTWQVKQKGGKGEPFYRDVEGFEIGIKMMIELGRNVFAEKWGHRGCDVERMGVVGEDAWRLERDWDEEAEALEAETGSW